MTTETKPQCPACGESVLCVRISQQWHCNSCEKDFGFTIKATPHVERDIPHNGFRDFVASLIPPPQNKSVVLSSPAKGNFDGT
jgi:hypothetical protein